MKSPIDLQYPFDENGIRSTDLSALQSLDATSTAVFCSLIKIYEEFRAKARFLRLACKDNTMLFFGFESIRYQAFDLPAKCYTLEEHTVPLTKNCHYLHMTFFAIQPPAIFLLPAIYPTTLTKSPLYLEESIYKDNNRNFVSFLVQANIDHVRIANHLLRHIEEIGYLNDLHP